MNRVFGFLEHFDWRLFITALSLIAIGLVTIYGIGISREPTELFLFYKQLAACGVGVLLIVLFLFLNYQYLKSYSLFIYLTGMILLILVLFFGHTINETQGWFRVGGLSFQPAELAKITLTIYLAVLLTKKQSDRLSWHTFSLSAIATALYVGLILLQPDFGSAMVFVGIWGVMAVFAKLPRKAWVILPIAALCALIGLWFFGLQPYQKDRIAAFLHPQTDTQNTGYNAQQARIAIGSGGLFGKGVGEGSQARLKFLPSSETDFIFAVIGEELGFAGVSLILALFFFIIYRYVKIAEESRDEFAAILMIGLVANLFIHFVVNVGMNLGIMPITGLPCPFLSAAASYLTTIFLSVAIAESVAVRRQKTL